VVERSAVVWEHYQIFLFAGHSLTVASHPDYTTFDIIGELMYGEPFNCLATSNMHPWVAIIFTALRAGEIIAFLKRYALTRSLLSVLMGKKMTATRADHKALTKERTDRRIALGAEGHGKKDFMWLVTSKVLYVAAIDTDLCYHSQVHSEEQQ
jgi:hypothetical protein